MNNSTLWEAARRERNRTYTWGEVTLVDESDVVGPWVDDDLTNEDLTRAMSNNACYVGASHGTHVQTPE